MPSANRFAVVRRIVPKHGVKIGCSTEVVQSVLCKDDAYALADAMQAKYPDEEYAVTETIFRYWTKRD